MDKIYRRSTQIAGREKKKKNEKNRVRNTHLNFRVTPAERDLIEARISLTGLSKAEFFIQSCLYQTILVKGNVKTFSEIKKQLKEIGDAVNINSDLTELTSAQQETLLTILQILDRI